ncbi:TIR domain-containing protein [Duganella sp. CF517]|uniref:toll/interleukin-1 receptor domain-containing protein n=1 Tax=Duganella sp. CF517 TaxID=1881038 RepID=UPI0008B7DF54|nr:toll/interleukin-1 receptor domain-containing protein [Duganella sp. CF517]SEO63885.1 TIR domain-containing protein [Duganella sp. CF517]
MAKLFFSYCHADEALRDRLEIHLSLLKNQSLISTWHDRGIVAGSNVDAAIDENLESADVILLLVSADFIASRYCYSIEMKRALERHADGTAHVIPVILEPCDWHTAPFGKLLAVPKDGKAVTTWANQAEAWTDVARQIRKVIEDLERARAETHSTGGGTPMGWGMPQPVASPSQPAFASASSVQPGYERARSSNLRLKKEFTDYDRDKFLHEAFDYMAKFFDASLDELAARNQGIKVRFQRLDAQRFSAVAYREGKSVAECSVRVGGLGGRSPALSFSYDANASANTSNEFLSVESDTQSMYFKAMGMQFRGGQQNSGLSEQGASEYFWGLFIDRLQR